MRDGAATSRMEGEIAAVKAERDQLAAENAQLKAAVREVEQTSPPGQACSRTGRPGKCSRRGSKLPDPTNQQKFLTIDKGAKNGVEVGMAVVAQGPNYIGQVTEVWEESSARHAHRRRYSARRSTARGRRRWRRLRRVAEWWPLAAALSRSRQRPANRGSSC